MLNEDIVRLNIEMLDFNADILVNGIPAGHQENTFCAFFCRYQTLFACQYSTRS